VAGVLGVLSLVAAFVSFGMLPVQLIGIALLVASAIFFLLELKFPGIGFPTVGGLVTLVLGGMFLFDSSVPNASVSPWVIAPVAVLAGLFFAFVVQSALRTRRLPPATPDRRLVGLDGTVTTTIAPQGVVHVASEQWTAVSRSGAIPAGMRVRVVDVEGLRLTVEPVETRPGVEPPVAVTAEGGPEHEVTPGVAPQAGPSGGRREGERT
jgi:membrane-bound ClpP family serine protease